MIFAEIALFLQKQIRRDEIYQLEREWPASRSRQEL